MSNTLPGAVFSYETNNIGDDVQSYGALLHLPRITAFLDRDRLDLAGLPEPHLTLLNSWFKLNPPFGIKGSVTYHVSRLLRMRGYGVPDSSVDPIPFGFYLGRPEILQHGWREYLQGIGPVGCRNSYTAELLDAAGIEAHVSGCIAMYFGRMFAQPEKRKGIVFIDIDPETEKAFIPKEISERAVRISNYVAPSIIKDPWIRFAAVARLVETLRTAELVVSRRLHGSLPCAGLGTPVVVLPNPAIDRIDKARNRAQGFEGILQVVYQDEPEKASSIDWRRKDCADVPRDLERRYRDLCSTLASRTGFSPRVFPKAFANEMMRIRNPGLPTRPGKILFQMGRNVAERRIGSWTSEEIELDVSCFAGLENLDATVIWQGRDKAAEPVGSLSELLIPPASMGGTCTAAQEVN